MSRHDRDLRRKLVHQDLEAELAWEAPGPPPMTDGPDLSDSLRLLEKVRRLPEVRFEKVEEMRRLIDRGEFETEERIDGTVRRLMDELGP